MCCGFPSLTALNTSGFPPRSDVSSLTVAIGATAVVIWMVQESRRLQMRGLIWVLLSCVTVAFAFGAPLFLYLRERRLQELARGG